MFQLEEVVAGNVDKLKKRYPGGEFNVYQSENRKEGDLMRDQLIKALLAHAQGDITETCSKRRGISCKSCGYRRAFKYCRSNRTRVRYDCKVPRPDRYHT